MTDIVGQTVGGDYATVVIREVLGADIQIGDLLACDVGNMTTILQVYDLKNSSQLSDRTGEMLSGTLLGDGPSGVQSCEPELPNYMLAIAKQLVVKRDVRQGKKAKRAVRSFTNVRRAAPEDLQFMDGRRPGPHTAGAREVRLHRHAGRRLLDGCRQDVVAPRSRGRAHGQRQVELRKVHALGNFGRRQRRHACLGRAREVS